MTMCGSSFPRLSGRKTSLCFWASALTYYRHILHSWSTVWCFISLPWVYEYAFPSQDVCPGVDYFSSEVRTERTGVERSGAVRVQSSSCVLV